MRILVTIPHAFLDLPTTAWYGSEGGNAAKRGAALLQCAASLRAAFGLNLRLGGEEFPLCNPANVSLTIVVCTSGDQHLVPTLPPDLVVHHPMDMHPRMLGFGCQALLQANLGHYDWYCYVEDDIEVSDPMLFDKLTWFNSCFGDKALLQPNRYEVSTGPVSKLYIDGHLVDAGASARFQDLTIRPRVMAAAFGRRFTFTKTNNPHAGCFFASAAQMAVMAAHPEFGRYSDAFNSSLESAATLPLMQNFDVYKPAPDNASFLEVRHLHQRILDVEVHYTRMQNGIRKTVTDRV